MPGLLRGVARTAVVAGTASAVAGRVQRHQAEKYAGRDAQIYADRQQAYQQDMQAQYAQQAPPQYAPPPQQYAAPAPAPAAAAPPPSPEANTIQLLQQLADLKAQGILTDEEFAAQKAKILGS